MKVFCIGDIVSSYGRNYLRSVLPKFKSENKIDVVIANGENSADGNGVSPNSAEDIFSSGVDVITTGNHVFKRREIPEYLSENPQIIRPLNWGKDTPGNGFYILDKGKWQMAVINLIGTVFMESMENPFYAIEEALKLPDIKSCKYILVDFHAEATAEKRALGYFCDGKISAIFGTHTHVQTSDDEIMPHKTGYITDIGMTGPAISVLGIKPEIIIQKFKTHLPQKFENPECPCKLNGIVFELDETTGKTIKTERINIIEK